MTQVVLMTVIGGVIFLGSCKIAKVFKELRGIQTDIFEVRRDAATAGSLIDDIKKALSSRRPQD